MPPSNRVVPTLENRTSRDSHENDYDSYRSVRSSAASPVKQQKTMSYEEMLTLLGATSKPNQDLDPEVMKRDVNRLKVRLAKSSRGLLNPHSKLMQYWDFCTLSALRTRAACEPSRRVCAVTPASGALRHGRTRCRRL